MLDRLPDTPHPRTWLALFCVLLWLPGFFTIPPGDRDESRFAQATRQMVDTGDYVRIRLGDEERNKKPAGIHWAQAAIVHGLEAAGLGGRADIWAYRGASFLGALLAVLACFQWGRALVGRRAAFVGAALLSTALVLVVEVHIAKTDAALLASITAAMGLMGAAYLAPGSFSARRAAAFWVALGVGILLKGPIAPMVPLLSGLSLFLMDRGWRNGTPWFRALRPAWGVPLMLTCAAPWFIAIGIATEGRFFAEAVGEDMLGKVGAGGERHWGPPGFYIAIFGVTAFPAAFFVLQALPAAWAQRVQPPVRFLLAWAVPVWLVFEAVATKLPHYALPAYPALMLLAARWMLDPLATKPRAWLRWLALAALWGVALVLPLALIGMIWWADGNRIDVFAVLALAAGVLLAVVVTREAWAGRWVRAALSAVILAIPFYGAILEGALPRISSVWLAPRVAAALNRADPALPIPVPPGRFGIAGYHEPSLLFATGGATALLRDGTAAAAFLAESPRRTVAVSDRDEVRFRAEATRLGLRPREMGLVTGINISRGRWLTLQLYGVE